MNVERVYTDEEAVELRTAHMLAKSIMGHSYPQNVIEAAEKRSEEDFEITEITFDEDFDVSNLLDECFEMNIPEIAAWFEGLEKSVVKAFHDKIEKDRKDQEDYYE